MGLKAIKSSIIVMRIKIKAFMLSMQHYFTYKTQDIKNLKANTSLIIFFLRREVFLNGVAISGAVSF